MAEQPLQQKVSDRSICSHNLTLLKPFSRRDGDGGMKLAFDSHSLPGHLEMKLHSDLNIHIHTLMCQLNSCAISHFQCHNSNSISYHLIG